MRYKAGWFIPQQVLALTHLVPDVTPDDFVGIVAATNACLQEVSQPFHMIIDNRLIQNEQVVSLDTILQAMPQLRLPSLRWIVMILPQSVRHTAANREGQRIDDIQLIYVDTLASALDALQALDASLNWGGASEDFFVEDRHVLMRVL
jgi:hypothetical protein